MTKRPYLALILLLFAVSIYASAQTVATSSPTVIAAVAPVYPAVANAGRATGDVIVEIEVTADGQVKKARAIRGNPLLRWTSERSAKRWKFAPLKDTQVLHRLVLTFTFNLLGVNDKESELGVVYYPPYKVAITAMVVKVKTTTDYTHLPKNK